MRFNNISAVVNKPGARDRLIHKISKLVSFEDEIEQQFEQGRDHPDLIERLEQDLDKSRASYKGLLEKVRSLKIDQELPKRVADTKHELFGLKAISLFSQKDRIYEYDPSADDQFRAVIDERFAEHRHKLTTILRNSLYCFDYNRMANPVKFDYPEVPGLMT